MACYQTTARRPPAPRALTELREPGFRAALRRPGLPASTTTWGRTRASVREEDALPFWRHFSAGNGRKGTERDRRGRKLQDDEPAIDVGKQRVVARLAFTCHQSSNPFATPRRSGRHPAIAKNAEGMAHQALDLLNELSRWLAISADGNQRGTKEFRRRVCPHRFPMLGDACCGECVSCGKRTFRVLRVLQPLRLGVHPVGSCIHSETGFGTKGSQVRSLSPRLGRPRRRSRKASLPRPSSLSVIFPPQSRRNLAANLRRNVRFQRSATRKLAESSRSPRSWTPTAVGCGPGRCR
jgi:hypothetical protein